MGKLASYSKLAYQISKRFVIPQMSRANISITSRCNQKCLTCNIWQLPARSIDRSDYSIMLTANNLMWVTITGGEPSTHPDFEDILRTSFELTPLVQVNTNGILGGKIENAVGAALKGGFDNMMIVSVSIFGDKYHHEGITRIPGSYEHAVATIKRLIKLHDSRLIVGIAHTICKYNTDQVPFIEKLAKSLGVGVSFAFEKYTGYYNNLNSVDGFRPVMPNIKLSMNPLDIFKDIFITHGDRKSGCVAGEYSCWVLPDLNVYPCISAIPNKPAFNLHGSDFKLNNFSDSVLKEVKNCAGCWTACETYQTLVFRPWRVLK